MALTNAQKLEKVINETTNCFISIQYNGSVWYTSISSTGVRVESDSLSELCLKIRNVILENRIPRIPKLGSRKSGNHKLYAFEGIKEIK